MNKSKMHTRLENTALKAMLERCVKQVDEKNARIREFHAASAKLVRVADDLKKENEALKAKLAELVESKIDTLSVLQGADSCSEWPGPVYNAIADQRPDWKPGDGYETE